MNAHQHLRSLAQRHDFAMVPGHEPSMWFRDRLHSILTRLRTGEQHRCPHLRGPVTGTVALWDDTLAVCPACALLLVRDGEPDRTCDRCGHVNDTHEAMHVIALAPAPLLLVMLGLCGPCYRREVPPT